MSTDDNAGIDTGNAPQYLKKRIAAQPSELDANGIMEVVSIALDLAYVLTGREFTMTELERIAEITRRMVNAGLE